MSKEKFQKAYAEMKVTTDPYRYAYLKWIGCHMWKLFDYKSGLDVINSEESFEEWKKPGRSKLVEEARQCIKSRDQKRHVIAFPLKLELYK